MLKNPQNFGERIRARREALHMTRAQLAANLGVTTSAVGNYENGISFPKEEVMLRLFDCLKTDPNDLYRDSFQNTSAVMSYKEKQMIDRYRALSNYGKDAVRNMIDTLWEAIENARVDLSPPTIRTIPLYSSPAAAGYLSPVFGADYEDITISEDIPSTAEKAVRIQGDSMEPSIPDGSVVYVNSDPLANGDVGIFCVDGDMYCKQYYKDAVGTIFLFSLNRERADADLVFTANSGRSCTYFGRVMIKPLPLPGR